MFQVGEYTFEITIHVVNKVERRTTQSANVKELRFSKNIGWSQFAYLKLRKTRSGFSIPLDFEIAKVAYILFIVFQFILPSNLTLKVFLCLFYEENTEVQNLLQSNDTVRSHGFPHTTLEIKGHNFFVEHPIDLKFSGNNAMLSKYCKTILCFSSDEQTVRN